MKIAPYYASASARWIAGRCKDFVRERGGNFGLLAALALVPMVGAVGLAYDYTNMLAMKTRMSDSLDAAAFEAAELYAVKASDSTIEERAGRIFRADMQQQVAEADYSFSYDGVFNDDGAVVVRVAATAAYHPTFMPALWTLLGQPGPTLAVSRRSEVSLSTSTVELALVLDNSGSMKGSKISALKDAAKSLVGDLFVSAAQGSKAEAVKVSVVPFAGSVNVGSENRNAAWMDKTGATSVHGENFDWSTIAGARKQADGTWALNGTKLTRFWLYDRLGVNWGGCVEARIAPYDTNNAPASAATPNTLYVPMFAPDEPSTGGYVNSYLGDDISGSWKKDSRGRSYWSEPTDRERQQNMTKYQGRLGGWLSSTFGPNYGCSTLSAMALSTDEKTVKGKLDDMVAEGSTNIPQGVAWGLNTLTPQRPLGDTARAYGTKRNIKAMVVMTDGENTYYQDNNMNQSWYGAYGFASTGRIHAGGTGNDGKNWNSAFTDSMNQHLLAVCKTARDTGVKVFTIAFDVDDGSSVKTMLRNCASDDAGTGGKLYFDAKDSDDLKSAFGVIGSKIAGLRLYR